VKPCGGTELTSLFSYGKIATHGLDFVQTPEGLQGSWLHTSSTALRHREKWVYLQVARSVNEVSGDVNSSEGRSPEAAERPAPAITMMFRLDFTTSRILCMSVLGPTTIALWGSVLQRPDDESMKLEVEFVWSVRDV